MYVCTVVLLDAQLSYLPYLRVYNVRPCIIRTPILDCTLKKKRKQKTEEVVTEKYCKNIKIWKHSKNDDLIISSEMSLDVPATKRSVLRWTLLAVSLCKIMDTVNYPLPSAP